MKRNLEHKKKEWTSSRHRYSILEESHHRCPVRGQRACLDRKEFEYPRCDWWMVWLVSCLAMPLDSSDWIEGGIRRE